MPMYTVYDFPCNALVLLMELLIGADTFFQVNVIPSTIKLFKYICTHAYILCIYIWATCRKSITIVRLLYDGKTDFKRVGYLNICKAV